MDRLVREERLHTHRVLVLLRMLLAPGFFLLLAHSAPCQPGVIGTLGFFLTAGVLAPAFVYILRPDWLETSVSCWGMVLFDFLLAAVICFFAARHKIPPTFFPFLFLLLPLQAAAWWGWLGAWVSGGLGIGLITWVYQGSTALLPDLRWKLVLMSMAWTIFLSCCVPWALRYWRGKRQMADWLSRQEEMVGQVHGQLQIWHETFLAMQKTSSLRDLLQTAMREAMKATASPIGLAVLRDPDGQDLRVECWEGFALSGIDRTTLRAGDTLPAPDGVGRIEVRHVLAVPLSALAANGEAGSLGRLVVARPADPPYRDDEAQRFHVLVGHATALVENRFLRLRLGRAEQQADRLAAADGPLVTLLDPNVAMEMACRNVLGALDLEQIMVYLYGRDDAAGCRVVMYPASDSARTATMPLQGRGLRLLRRFLDSGTTMILNRRGEWPELFDLMGWEAAQAVACFPLYVLGHRWGALCLLARVPDAFPPQTQQSLAIFSREIAMSLENWYLRRAVQGASS